MFASGTRPPSGVNESCIELTAPHDVSVVTVANSAEAPMPKRHSLPSMLPPATPSACTSGLPAASAAVRDGEARGEEERHRDEQRPALPLVFREAAVRVRERGADQRR